MAYFQFIASRNLAAGYTAGDSVGIQVKCSSVTQHMLEVFKKTHHSITRTPFHRVAATEQRYTLETAPVVGSESIALMNMFLWSVVDGSSFTGDLNSNVGLSFSDYQIHGKTPDPQKLSSSIYTYKFSIVAI
ncbi:MAG: hypothetical protein GY862_26860 [Gammaproteobacteria bacterium]|nr:hypothetical protein [Gammaproteobacteria bacterium]MCP5013814.1 hypothetical protein [Ketobacter sp.]